MREDSDGSVPSQVIMNSQGWAACVDPDVVPEQGGGGVFLLTIF